MVLSDCPKCWETPCCCGYVGSEDEAKFIAKIIGIGVDEFNNAISAQEEREKIIKARDED